MATFYVLPPRACLDDLFAQLLTTLLPGLPIPAEPWETIAAAICGSWPEEVYLIPRDDLPDGVAVIESLQTHFGAEPHDRIVDIPTTTANRLPRLLTQSVSMTAQAR